LFKQFAVFLFNKTEPAKNARRVEEAVELFCQFSSEANEASAKTFYPFAFPRGISAYPCDL
jgi:hypothetical protein